MTTMFFPGTPAQATPLDAPYDAHLLIGVADWDLLFEAVETTLRRIVGERLDCPPEVPAHSAALSASLVQTVVLDCVSSLERLHAALKQERSQRPTHERAICDAQSGTASVSVVSMPTTLALPQNLPPGPHALLERATGAGAWTL